MTGPVTGEWLSCGIGDFIGLAIFIFIVAQVIGAIRKSSGQPSQPLDLGSTEPGKPSSGNPEDELKRFLRSLGGEETVQEPAVPPPIPQELQPRRAVKPPLPSAAILQRRQEITAAFQQPQAPEPVVPVATFQPPSRKKNAQEVSAEKTLNDLRQILRKTDSQRQAVMLSEILGLPVGFRREHPAYYH